MTNIRVFSKLAISNAQELFDHVAEKMAPWIEDEAELSTRLMAREKLSSTNLGQGLAFPHCKLDKLKEFHVGVFVNEMPIIFGLPSAVPVDLFVVVVAPSRQPDAYIKLIGKISQVLKKELSCQACRHAQELPNVIEILGV